MRDFEQRREEIFRRSQARIQARRKRNKRIVMTCVPVALCLCVAGFFLSGPFAVSNDCAEAENNSQFSCDQSSNGSLITSLVEVRVTDGKGERVYTDPQVVQMVSAMLTFPETEDGSTVADRADGALMENMAAALGCVLKVTDVTGTETTYALLDGQLTELDSGRSRVLDDAQLKQLREALELGAEGGDA